MKPMKKRMLQDHTIQDALAFWQLLRRGRFRPLLAEPTENTIIQLFRYVITGASSFLVDFLLLFLLELAGLYYLPASAVSFLVGISHFSIRVPSISNRPSFTVVPPTSIPIHFFPIKKLLYL